MNGKVCKKCGIIKPLDDFPVDKEHKDGHRNRCKACRHIYITEYYRKNKERILENGKRYISEHGQERKEYCKQYKKNNPEKIKHLMSKWRQNNREKLREYQKELYKKNPDIYRIPGKKWAKANPDSARKRSQRRRARKMGLSEHFTVQEWIELKKSVNHTCLACGRSEPEIKLTADHIIPLFYGGKDTIDNIQPLCLSCNDSKGIKSINYKRISK